MPRVNQKNGYLVAYSHIWDLMIYSGCFAVWIFSFKLLRPIPQNIVAAYFELRSVIEGAELYQYILILSLKMIFYLQIMAFFIYNSQKIPGNRFPTSLSVSAR
jgi:hypothetical protein